MKGEGKSIDTTFLGMTFEKKNRRAIFFIYIPRNSARGRSERLYLWLTIYTGISALHSADYRYANRITLGLENSKRVHLRRADGRADGETH